MLRIQNKQAPTIEAPPEAPPVDVPAEPEVPTDVPTDTPSAQQGRFSVDKVDKAIAVYMGPEMGPFACSNCQHFDGQSGCGIVEGDIDPDGVCNLFTPPDQHELPEEAQMDAPPDESTPVDDGSAPPVPEVPSV